MTQTKEEELLIFLRGSKSTNCLSDKEIELIAKFLEYAEQLTRQKDERIEELEKALARALRSSDMVGSVKEHCEKLLNKQ
jgi:hypothetical protein